MSKPASWHINSADFIGKTLTHIQQGPVSYTTLHTPEMRTKRESPNLFWDIRKCITKQRFACLRRGTVLIVYIYIVYTRNLRLCQNWNTLKQNIHLICLWSD